MRFSTLRLWRTVEPSPYLQQLLLNSFLLAASLSTASAAQTNELINLSSTWRYWQSGALDGVNWKAPDYDDTAWASGPGLLYVETAALPAPTNTPLVLGQRTYYFRTPFTFSGGTPELALGFRCLIDDGAVFYLNGTEVRRVGMPNGTISASTLASRTVGDAVNFDAFLISGSQLTNLVNGTNMLAVEVHQSDPASSDIVFGLQLNLITELLPRVTRGPYLQNASSTAISLRWRTDLVTNSRVRYGTNAANLDLVAEDFAFTAEHELRLTNLQPATTYFYSVGTTNAPLAGGGTNHFFITSPIPGTPQPTRIWVIGDAGTRNANQVRVRDAYAAFAGSQRTDLWLMLGDNAYDNGTDTEYQSAVFNIYTNLLRNTPVWSTLGNHETAQSTVFNDNYPYFNIFTLPKNGEAGGMASGTEHYYSFDYANIHFICLDSMTASRSTNGAMAVWLTNDLANATADWIIAYWHHPPYTKGSHDSDAEIELIQMRQNFLPILESYGVDLVLSGHSHCYERSYLLDRHYGISRTLSATNKLDAGNGRENGTGAYSKQAGDPIGHRGTVYAVVGSSGQISGGSLNHPAMFVSLNQLGSMALDISGDRLDARFIRDNGTTNDSFTIFKVNTPPDPPVLIAPTNSVTLLTRYPTLDISVSDPDTNLLSVTLFGRALSCQNGEQADRHKDESDRNDGRHERGRDRENHEDKHHGHEADCGMTSTNPFTVLGRFAKVESGRELTLVWTNLQPETTHEWFVTISDGKDITTGPVWQFRTQKNFRPEARSLVVKVPANVATQIQLVADDRNEDPLVFAADTAPKRGIISAFNPTNGSFIYTPAHGASGPDKFRFHVNDGLADSTPAFVRLLIQKPDDLDRNGLPDSWELAFGVSDPNADGDGDGLNNLQEYLANTNPTNTASVLKIVSMAPDANGHFTLTWSAIGGTRYRVSYNDTGSAGDNACYKDIIRPITAEMNSAPVGSPALQSFTDDFTLTPSPTSGFRYYRVRVVSGDHNPSDHDDGKGGDRD